MTKPIALITGATGWLGTRFTRTLAEGLPGVARFEAPNPDRPIRCLVRTGEGASKLKKISGSIEIFEGDITQPESMKAFFNGAEGATLFHTAAVIHPTKGVKEFYETNVQGTQNLIEAAATANIRRMVHVSSNSPIGVNPSADHRFDESSPYNPYMGYGKSKMLAEQAVLKAHEAGKFEVSVIRPPWFYGPDQPPRQTLFFSMIKKGMGPILGNGENQRSMAYTDNICQGMRLCEKEKAANGEIFWIADAEPYSMNTILDTVERVLENDFNIEVAHKRMKLPGFSGDFAQLCDKMLQSVGIYHQKIHVLGEMNKTIACSIEKAQRVLGYDPKISLEEGMRRSIAWILDQGIEI